MKKEVVEKKRKKNKKTKKKRKCICRHGGVSLRSVPNKKVRLQHSETGRQKKRAASSLSLGERGAGSGEGGSTRQGSNGRWEAISRPAKHSTAKSKPTHRTSEHRNITSLLITPSQHFFFGGGGNIDATALTKCKTVQYTRYMLRV